jgi:hypothetical protein
VLTGQDCGQFVQTLVDGLSSSLEVPGPLVAGRTRPAHERALGGFQGTLSVGAPTPGGRAHGLAVDRVDDFKGLARLGSYPFSIDEKLEVYWLHSQVHS